MRFSLFHTVQVMVSFSATLALGDGQVCSQISYTSLLPLSGYSKALSYCSQSYPVSCTSAMTTTIRTTSIITDSVTIKKTSQGPIRTLTSIGPTYTKTVFTSTQTITTTESVAPSDTVKPTVTSISTETLTETITQTSSVEPADTTTVTSTLTETDTAAETETSTSTQVDTETVTATETLVTTLSRKRGQAVPERRLAKRVLGRGIALQNRAATTSVNLASLFSSLTKKASTARSTACSCIETALPCGTVTKTSSFKITKTVYSTAIVTNTSTTTKNKSTTRTLKTNATTTVTISKGANGPTKTPTRTLTATETTTLTVTKYNGLSVTATKSTIITTTTIATDTTTLIESTTQTSTTTSTTTVTSTATPTPVPRDPSCARFTDAASGSDGTQFLTEDNTFITMGNLLVREGVANETECIDVCIDSARCKYFTFNKNNLNCELLSAPEVCQSTSDDFVSGTRVSDNLKSSCATFSREATASDGQEFMLQDSTYIITGTLIGDKIYVDTELECMDACTGNDNCDNFTFSPTMGYCEILRSPEVCQGESEEYLSGVKTS